jgi:hypothetical protein
MAVHADDAFLWMLPALHLGSLLLSFTQFVHKLDECINFVWLGRDLGHGGKLVVMDAASLETPRVIDRLIFGDVNDILDNRTPIANEFRGTVHIVRFSKCLQRAEDGFSFRPNHSRYWRH